MISRHVTGFLNDLFTVSPSGEFSASSRNLTPLDEAAIQSELIEIKAGDMKAALHGADNLSAFWVVCPQEYDTMKTLAISVLAMVESTYTCEAASSKVNSRRLLSHKPDRCQALH